MVADLGDQRQKPGQVGVWALLAQGRGGVWAAPLPG